jgi:hypothetical protein
MLLKKVYAPCGAANRLAKIHRGHELNDFQCEKPMCVGCCARLGVVNRGPRRGVYAGKYEWLERRAYAVANHVVHHPLHSNQE